MVGLTIFPKSHFDNWEYFQRQLNDTFSVTSFGVLFSFFKFDRKISFLYILKKAFNKKCKKKTNINIFVVLKINAFFIKSSKQETGDNTKKELPMDYDMKSYRYI